MKPFFPYDQKVKTKNCIPSEPKELLRWNKKVFFIIIKRLSLQQVKQFFWKVRVRLQKFFLLKLNRFSALTIHEITRNFLIRYVKSNTPIVTQEKWKNVHLFIFTRFSVKNLKLENCMGNSTIIWLSPPWNILHLKWGTMMIISNFVYW